MNLQIIGFGGMWNKENSASYLIDNHILIDIPNGSCKNLYNFGNNIENIDNVLITHFHGDHYFDIPFYLLKKSKEDELDVIIYCNKDGKKKIETLFKLGFPSASKKVLKRLNLKYNFSKNFKIGNYEITRIIVSHGDFKPAYGYIFKNDNLTIGFTGDTGYCDNVDYMASICDYLICDCSLILGNESHMGIDDIKKLANKYPNHKFVTSHMFSETIKEAKKLKIKNIIVPNDGDFILNMNNKEDVN